MVCGRSMMSLWVNCCIISGVVAAATRRDNSKQLALMPGFGLTEKMKTEAIRSTNSWLHRDPIWKMGSLLEVGEAVEKMNERAGSGDPEGHRSMHTAGDHREPAVSAAVAEHPADRPVEAQEFVEEADSQRGGKENSIPEPKKKGVDGIEEELPRPSGDLNLEAQALAESEEFDDFFKITTKEACEEKCAASTSEDINKQRTDNAYFKLAPSNKLSVKQICMCYNPANLQDKRQCFKICDSTSEKVLDEDKHKLFDMACKEVCEKATSFAFLLDCRLSFLILLLTLVFM